MQSSDFFDSNVNELEKVCVNLCENALTQGLCYCTITKGMKEKLYIFNNAQQNNC